MDVKKLSGNAQVRPQPPPARGSQRARGTHPNGSASSSVTNLHSAGVAPTSNPMARKMIVPQYSGPASQVASLDGARDPLNNLRRSESSASARSLPALPYRASNTLTSQPPPLPANKPQVLRKNVPPPIPNKKSSLVSMTASPGSSSASTSMNNTPLQSYRDKPSGDESRPEPPPPRRSMAASSSAARKPIPNLIDEDVKPALPPRTGTGLSTMSSGGGGGGGRILLDEEPDEMKNTDGWEVLKPMR